MGKSARMREQRRLLREEENEEAIRLRRRRRTSVLIFSAIALVVIIAIALTMVVSTLSHNGFFRRRSVSMETEHFKITDQMMSYYIYSMFQSFQSQYGDQLDVSTDISLKAQDIQEGTSWFDYVSQRAQANLKQVLMFAEKALEQGVSLSEEELTDLTEYMDNTDISVYQSLFGLTREDLRQALELTSLSTKMYEQIAEEMKFSDEDIAAYYEENAKYFQAVDYKVISFPYGENAWYENAEVAKGVADRLAEATTTDEFDTLTGEILMMIGASEEDVQKELEEASHTSFFVDNDKFLEWAFADNRQPPEIYVEDTGSAYNVYQLLTLPARDETQKYNVRHILLTPDSYGTEDAAKARAEALLKEWRSGEATEETFGVLAEQYSDDGDSRSAGGLYENIVQGEMVETFDNWCFQQSRQPGDAGVVKTEFGYHVMYFVGPGQQQWEQTVEISLLSKRTQELCESYLEIWPVKVNERHIARLPL